MALATTLAGMLLPWSAWPAAAAPLVEASSQPAVWSPVRGAAPRFALEIPELEKLPAASGLFRNGTGATEDRLSRGSLQAAEAPFVEFVLRHRAGQPPTTLFVGLARLTASEGFALLHLAAPASLATRYGSFAGAAAWLADERTERPCLVFRHTDAHTDLEIAGWYCSAEGNDPEPQVVACLIDRLALTEAVDDPGLKRIFATAAAPTACAAPPAETVTGAIAAPPATARKAKNHKVRSHKAKAHRARAHKAHSPARQRRR